MKTGKSKDLITWMADLCSGTVAVKEETRTKFAAQIQFSMTLANCENQIFADSTMRETVQ